MILEFFGISFKYISEIDPRDLLITGKNYLLHLFKTLYQEISGEWSPTTVGIEITYYCNRRCKGCYIENNIKKDREVMSAENLETIVLKLQKNGILFTGIVGGDPMQDFTIPTLKKVIQKYPFNSFFIYVNPDYLVKYGLSELSNLHNLTYCVSVDGMQKNHEKIRGKGSFQKLMRSFDILRKARKVYSASVTIRKETLNELTSREFIELMLEKGVKYILFMKFKSEDETNLSEEEYFQAIKRIKENSRGLPIVIIYGGIKDGISLSPFFNYKELFIDIEGNFRVAKINTNENLGNLFNSKTDLKKILDEYSKKLRGFSFF
ncbi:MAG: radical SAM protein [Candidatus Woesearchaeota archaeon]